MIPFFALNVFWKVPRRSWKRGEGQRRRQRVPTNICQRILGAQKGGPEDLLSEMARRGLRCPCIRCREVGTDVVNAVARAELVERQYRGSEAEEYFLSFETTDTAQTICGFLRLRLPEADEVVHEDGAALAAAQPAPERIDSAFPELQGCALIRELHVYGWGDPSCWQTTGHHGGA